MSALTKQDKVLIRAFLKDAEKSALKSPGVSYRRIVVRENLTLCLVHPQSVDGFFMPSEIVGEIFAVKDKGSAVYSSFNN